MKKEIFLKIILSLLTYDYLMAMDGAEDLLRLFQEESTEPEIICHSIPDGVFSPDGSKILDQDRLIIYETKRSNYELKLEAAKNIGSEFGIKKARWSPQGTYVYTKGKSLKSGNAEDQWWQKFYVWNAETGQLLCTIPHVNHPDCAKFTQKERYFLTKGIGRRLEVYDINKRYLKAQLGDEDSGSQMMPQPVHEQFIVHFQHPNTHFYGIDDFRELAKIEGILKCFSDDGKLMAIDHDISEKKANNGIVLCDCNTLQMVRKFNGHTNVCLYKNGRLLSSCFGEVIYDVVTGNKLYEKHLDLPGSLTKSYPSLDLSKVVHLNSDGNKKTQISITDLNGQGLYNLTIDADIQNVRFDSQGNYAVLGKFDDIIAVVSLKTGRIVRTYKNKESFHFGFWRHAEKPFPLFSSDGKFLEITCDQYRNRWARILKLAE